MKPLPGLNAAQLFMEIGQDRLKARREAAAIELPLDRQEDGRLTEACKANLASQLPRFIDHKNWQPRPRVFCAIAARGVAFRRLSLPRMPREELHRILPLQIENEFPLPPDRLAWGFQVLNPVQASDERDPNQQVLVVVVKREILEEYSDILADSGATPVFTVGALARSYLCPQPPGSYSVLDFERTYSELITIEAGVPVAVRVLAWGREDFLRAGAQLPGNGGEPVLSLVEASNPSAPVPVSNNPGRGRPRAAAMDPLVRMLAGQALGQRLYLLGSKGLPPALDLPATLAQQLGQGVECQEVTIAPDPSDSTAIQGMERALQREPGSLPLVFRSSQVNGRVHLARGFSVKWAAAAVGVALAALLLPYAEALTLKSHLAHKLAGLKTDQGRLAVMDRELDFFEYLKANEPPYLDALLVVSKAAPQGTRFDAISMNRRGEVTLRGSLRDGQQVAELRSKLIDSGFFANVAIEEQTPTPDHQKVNIRLSGQWKPAESRTIPKLEPAHGPTQPRGGPAPPPDVRHEPATLSAPRPAPAVPASHN